MTIELTERAEEPPEDPVVVEGAWIQEAERRLAKIRSGAAKLNPGETVMAKLHAMSQNQKWP